jgi:arabinogalactan oligomer/maltooligosaccharide transport system substrate-binding protein
MKTGVFLGLGVLLVASLPMAACAAQAPPVPTVISAPQPTATATPTLLGKIILWHAWSGGEAEGLKEVIQRFQADYPQVVLEADYVPASQLPGAFADALSSGRGPTLVIAAQDWGPSWFDAGRIANLVDLVPPGVLNSLNPTALDAVEYRGALIGLPETIKGILLFRNKRIVGTAPASFDELVRAAKSATKGGIVGADLETGLLYSGANLTSACGGHLSDSQGRPAFNSDAGLCFLQMLARFKAAGPVELNSGHDVTAFEAGKAGIILDGSWDATALAEAVGISNLAVDPWPSYGSAKMSGYLQTENLYLAAQISGGDRQAALAFMQFFLSPQSQEVLANPAGADHVPSVSGLDIADPLMQQEIAILATNVAYPAQIWGTYADPLNAAIQKVVQANADPRAALKEAEDAVNRKTSGG